MTRPTYNLEQTFCGRVAGFDEAGCGPWAGPVVAAAVIFLDHPDHLTWTQQIHDSKKLSEKKRNMLFEQLIHSDQIVFGVGIASVQEIDQLNIGQAARLAMQRAHEQLSQKPDVALVDGIRMPQLPCPTHPVVKGDQLSLSIAAASILAKVTRDRLMSELDQDYPAYGWAKNAGYGTAIHQKALRENGLTPHHRLSFKPIAALKEKLAS